MDLMAQIMEHQNLITQYDTILADECKAYKATGDKRHYLEAQICATIIAAHIQAHATLVAEAARQERVTEVLNGN